MADILFVHTNFPAQFRFIAPVLKERGHRCASIGSSTAAEQPGIPLLRWKPIRSSTPDIFLPVQRTEANMIRARSVLEPARALAAQGFSPKLIIGHAGWGETAFLRDVFPKARMIAYAEYYHTSDGGVFGYDPEFRSEPTLEERVREHAKNAVLAMAYAEADALVSPTEFQASFLPASLRRSVRLIHEGIDTDYVRPYPEATLGMQDGRSFTRDDQIITFINRRFEPLRGFHIFMRALPAIQAALPNVQVLMIGMDDRDVYGKQAPKDSSWKAELLREMEGRIDLSRVHFTGRVSHQAMLAAISLSSAHIYYTYPFVMSWSLLEAMASGALVVGSRTGPVTEVIRDGENGVLSDFFDVQGLADKVIEACREPGKFMSMRKAARETVVERYDRSRVCLPAWLSLVDEMLAA